MKIFPTLVTVFSIVLVVGCMGKHEQRVSVGQNDTNKGDMLQPPTEPSFDGKALSAWLEVLGRPGPWQGNLNWKQEDYTAAANAITNLGSKAIPFLRYALTANENRQGAVAACRLLGPESKPAVPELVNSLRAGCNYAAYALIEIDPTAISFITDSLTNQNSEMRYEAVRALSLGQGIPVDITTARPALLKCLDDNDGRVRNEATNLIRRMGGKLPWTDPPKGTVREFE